MGFSLTFTTNQYPYIKNYFICFHNYVRDNNTTSLMNYGDVLLYIDGMDIEGKQLQEIKHHCMQEQEHY
jgi:hypothetical protein